MATTRQKMVIKEIVENGGNLSKAMVRAGYSPATAENPKKVTSSIGFRELIEKMGISDEKLSQVLDDGLGATKAIVMGVKSEESFVDVQPDYLVRHKYLETALKLKGYSKETITNNITIQPILVKFIDGPNS